MKDATLDSAIEEYLKEYPLKHTMHYKNGREVKIGDWVVGITHNSNLGIRVGVVLSLMPEQGPCNVKLLIWKEQYDIETSDLVPMMDLTPQEDWADTKRLIHVMDGWRMVTAVLDHGNWDAPYFTPKMAMGPTS